MTTEALYKLFEEHPEVTTDSRQCPADSLFFALKGDSFDGNRFAAQALSQGCAYAVVDDPAVVPTDDNRYVLVDDVLRTYQLLAREHRRHFTGPVIQITGTNGKTTTKELTAAVLSKRYCVHYTQGNLNNHIGVPRTLLGLRPEHTLAVIETGANHPGEIKTLTEIVEPDCGIITNVGRAHLEGFGSFEGVKRTKGELYDWLRRKQGGFIFLCADNGDLTEMAAGMAALKYGRPNGGGDLTVEGEVTACAPFLALRWRRAGSKDWNNVQTRLIGAYNVDNVLAAVTAGVHFGVSDTDITAALEAYVPANNRSELRVTQRNRLIVDAYNANPTSMRAALENFKAMPGEHKMAILGEMRELGEVSEEEHRKVVEQLEASGLENVWLVGENFCNIPSDFRCFINVEEVKQTLADETIEGKLILIKGSNGTKLFQLPDYL
jgi:UDP-N-acetylmuramoyl-tripeptide--D-alanyl-D-alanine ligase